MRNREGFFCWIIDQCHQSYVVELKLLVWSLRGTMPSLWQFIHWIIESLKPPMLLCCSFLQNCLADRMICCTSFPNLMLPFMLGRKLSSPFCFCRVILFHSNGSRLLERLYFCSILVSCLDPKFGCFCEEIWHNDRRALRWTITLYAICIWEALGYGVESVKLRVKDQLLLIFDGCASSINSSHVDVDLLTMDCRLPLERTPRIMMHAH